MPPSPLQSQFSRIYRSIRLSRAEKATLAQKREVLIKDLRAGLKKIFALFPTKAPGFQVFHQGSYALNTGIRPLSGESFDIDIGLRLSIDRQTYPDPVLAKQWVYEALNRNYYRQVEYRRPCVRVQYQQKRTTDPLYHVDLAVYCRERSGQFYLAWGKPNSKSSLRYWEVADPIGLRKWIEKRMGTGAQSAQFRRLVAFMKRWKDLRFSPTGNQRPTGIAMTIAVCQHFRHVPGNDLLALQGILQGMTVWNQSLNGLYLPVAPRNDLLGKMTHRQKRHLAERLTGLSEQLQEIDTIAPKRDEVQATTLLERNFGIR